MADAKLFGKYNELMLLLIGFFLTAIVGGGLTRFYQYQSEDAQRQFQQVERDIQDSKSAFDEYSENVGAVVLASARLFDAVANHKSEAFVAQKRDALVEASTKEYVERQRVTVALRLSFGSQVADHYGTEAVELTKNSNDLVSLVHSAQPPTAATASVLSKAQDRQKLLFGQYVDDMLQKLDCKNRISDFHTARKACHS